MGNEISMPKDADPRSSSYDDQRSNPDSADSASSYTESNDAKSRKFHVRTSSAPQELQAAAGKRTRQRKKSSSQHGNGEATTRTLRRKHSQSSNSQEDLSSASTNTSDDPVNVPSPSPPQFKFFDSPIQDILEAGCKVLELGCNAGDRVIMLAKAFPNSQFLAIELSRSGIAKLKNPPKNLTFQTIDSFLRLPLDDGSFDFVHSKLNFSKILADQWVTVLEEVVRVTRPGGFVELTEPDHPLYSYGPQTMRWAEAARNSMTQYGLHLSPGSNLEGWLSKFPSLVFSSANTTYHLLGSFRDGSLLLGYIAQQKVPCMRMYDMKSEEFDKFASECLFECIEQQTCIGIYTVYAQKSSLA